MANPPPDNPAIPDAAELWRRIVPAWWVADRNTGQRRLSTQAFENLEDLSLSVTIAAECAGRHVLLNGHDGYGLAALSAGHARSCKQGIQRAPTENDPAHAHIIGEKPRSVRKCLLGGTSMLVEPNPGN